MWFMITGLVVPEDPSLLEKGMVNELNLQLLLSKWHQHREVHVHYHD